MGERVEVIEGRMAPGRDAPGTRPPPPGDDDSASDGQPDGQVAAAVCECLKRSVLRTLD